jgi:nucleotide-binding universal stress UspA family protein
MSVVVGVDSSPHSAVVLGEAILEAQRRSTDLHVVHVFNPPVVYLEVPIDIVRVADAEKAAVWGPLEALISAAGVEVTKVDLDGYPPDTLVSYATETGATLLVVGTRGRGELASLILGSTSARAIHLARCDVLVVKPKEE